MKFISWNVNGIRACLKKGFMDFFDQQNADVFAIQETKMQEGQAEVLTDGYNQFWCSAEKKGYSGVATFSKKTPISIKYGIDIEEHDHEGRVITAEFENFFFIVVYTPNSKEALARLEYRMSWEDAFRDYLVSLDKVKPVVVCGDLNVAHSEIDLKNPKTNRKNAGFSDEERAKMTELLEAGFTDTFRFLYPDKTDAYSWWSYRFNARKNNAGWRIDYFIVSDRIKDKIKDSVIYSDVFGSDHCPIGLEINL